MRYVVTSNFVEPPVFRTSTQNRLPTTTHFTSSMPLARRSRSRLLLLIIFGVLGYWYFFTGESRSAVETSVSHLEDGILAKPEPGKFGYKEQPSPDLGAPKKVENIAEPAAKPPAKQAEPLVLAKPAKPKSTPALGKPVIRQDAYMAATILPGPAAAVGAKQPQQQPKVVNGAGHAKAADVATQTLAYYGAIPTALTGKARTNALRLANQAKLAELEAAEALGRATAAKVIIRAKFSLH
ncbi:hypothetical protein HK097_007807 [Rhizophlyctis rosea]|uniref:Uncharacterized protein n=1 Tax=Rhizophlyctis rosea TaxID=64517 RepID=A0AAD5X804_9FUNG|nr:hypothetical protein HK097_007807 [Rhizophlyctis rosea]